MYELCFYSSINVRPNGCLEDIDKFLRKNNFPTSQMFQIYSRMVGDSLQ